jgi:hypothetical protein
MSAPQQTVEEATAHSEEILKHIVDEPKRSALATSTAHDSDEARRTEELKREGAVNHLLELPRDTEEFQKDGVICWVMEEEHKSKAEVEIMEPG